MEVLDNYSDELVQIQENIEESFTNLCKLWDQIGVFSDNKRSELKSQIVSGSVDAVIRYLNSIYDSELEVSGCKWFLSLEQEWDGKKY